jgi:hypothetical protein
MLRSEPRHRVNVCEFTITKSVHLQGAFDFKTELLI